MTNERTFSWFSSHSHSYYVLYLSPSHSLFSIYISCLVVLNPFRFHCSRFRISISFCGTIRFSGYTCTNTHTYVRTYIGIRWTSEPREGWEGVESEGVGGWWVGHTFASGRSTLQRSYEYSSHPVRPSFSLFPMGIRVTFWKSDTKVDDEDVTRNRGINEHVVLLPSISIRTGIYGLVILSWNLLRRLHRLRSSLWRE